MNTQQATATYASTKLSASHQQRPLEARLPITPTAYTLGFNAGIEGYEYANPYWGDLPRWLAYDQGHSDGRQAAVALAAARGFALSESKGGGG